MDPSGGAYLWDLPVRISFCAAASFNWQGELLGRCPTGTVALGTLSGHQLVAPLILRTAFHTKNPAEPEGGSITGTCIWNDDTPPGCTITAALGAINNAPGRGAARV